jgi:hypothetical protein
MSDDPNYSPTTVQVPAQPPVPAQPQVIIRTSTLAIVSLVTGILCWFLLPLIGAIIAVVTGHMAKNEIRQSNGLITGEGMATAGLVLGYIHLGLSVIGLCILAILLAVGFGLFGTIIRSSSLVLPFIF